MENTKVKKLYRLRASCYIYNYQYENIRKVGDITHGRDIYRYAYSHDQALNYIRRYIARLEYTHWNDIIVDGYDIEQVLDERKNK